MLTLLAGGLGLKESKHAGSYSYAVFLFLSSRHLCPNNRIIRYARGRQQQFLILRQTLRKNPPERSIPVGFCLFQRRLDGGGWRTEAGPGVGGGGVLPGCPPLPRPAGGRRSSRGSSPVLAPARKGAPTASLPQCPPRVSANRGGQEGPGDKGQRELRRSCFHCSIYELTAKKIFFLASY